jgi:hypothetical protein
MRHPDLFGIAVDHSGDKYFELCYRADIPASVAALARYEGSAARFLAGFPHPPTERGRHWFTLVNMLAMASCYSPNDAAPVGLRPPLRRAHRGAAVGGLESLAWPRPGRAGRGACRRAAVAAALLARLRPLGRAPSPVRQPHLHQPPARSLDRPHVRGVRRRHTNVAHRYDVSLRALSTVLGDG